MFLRILKYRLLVFIVTVAAAHALSAYVPKDMATRLQGKKIITGSLHLLTPPVAENGAEVRITIAKIDLPSPSTWIKEILFYVPYNEKPLARFKTEKPGLVAPLGLRVKIRGTTTLYAYALLSNGDILGASTVAKVTRGGCGDGGGIFSAPCWGTYAPMER